MMTTEEISMTMEWISPSQGRRNVAWFVLKLMDHEEMVNSKGKVVDKEGMDDVDEDIEAVSDGTDNMKATRLLLTFRLRTKFHAPNIGPIFYVKVYIATNQYLVLKYDIIAYIVFQLVKSLCN